jgi:hypothetical protein
LLKCQATSLRTRLIKRLTKEKVQASVYQIEQILKEATINERWFSKIKDQIRTFTDGKKEKLENIA